MLCLSRLLPIVLIYAPSFYYGLKIEPNSQQSSGTLNYSDSRSLRRRQDRGADAKGCRAYEIISARATTENQNKPVGSAKFIKDVLKSVPGGARYEVKYPASLDFAGGPPKGVKDIDARISKKLTECPDQRYVFFGYSQGAMVITEYLKKHQLPNSKVAAVVLYGNPFHVPNAPQNQCSGKTGKGIGSRTGIKMPSQYEASTFDCCKQGDMICQTVGTLGPHLSYPVSKEEKDAAAFVTKKLSDTNKAS